MRVLRHDLKNFASGKKIAGERASKSKVYFSENNEKLGSGLFSNVGSFLTPAVELIKNNKDLIVEGAKGAATIGSVANSISKVIDAVKEDKKLKEIELIQELRNKQQEQEKAKVSEKNKNKIAELASNEVARRNGVPAKQGDGFVKF